MGTYFICLHNHHIGCSRTPAFSSVPGLPRSTSKEEGERREAIGDEGGDKHGEGRGGDERKETLTILLSVIKIQKRCVIKKEEITCVIIEFCYSKVHRSSVCYFPSRMVVTGGVLDGFFGRTYDRKRWISFFHVPLVYRHLNRHVAL